MLPYRLTLQLLRPAARPATLYRADDGDDTAQVWVLAAGGEVLAETLGGGECCRLWRPLPLVRACELRREIYRGAYHGH